MMPPDIKIGVFILGAVLILIGILGGNFKLFGAEVASTISSRFFRFIVFFLGVFFILIAMGNINWFKPGSPVTMTKLENIDLKGGDIVTENGDLLRVQVKNADECSKVCEDNINCIAFTYVKPNCRNPQPYYCYLKDQIKPPIEDICYTSGKKILN